LAGVWDHSNFRQDLLGRLRRTGQFISGTTYGSRADAEWLIEKVKTIHLKVTGNAADGRPYAASDPALLTWVHVAEVHSFLQAHLRYRNPHLSAADQDRYYAEIALIADRASKLPLICTRSARNCVAMSARWRFCAFCSPPPRQVLWRYLRANG
jgi:uncharacterized protein (DUF2236 family)